MTKQTRLRFTPEYKEQAVARLFDPLVLPGRRRLPQQVSHLAAHGTGTGGAGRPSPGFDRRDYDLRGKQTALPSHRASMPNCGAGATTSLVNLSPSS